MTTSKSGDIFSVYYAGKDYWSGISAAVELALGRPTRLWCVCRFPLPPAGDITVYRGCRIRARAL